MINISTKIRKDKVEYGPRDWSFYILIPSYVAVNNPLLKYVSAPKDNVGHYYYVESLDVCHGIMNYIKEYLED